jgi:hypothetical protein
MSIIYTRPASGSVPNPTTTFLPVNIGGSFVDSNWTQDGVFNESTSLETVDNNATPFGFQYRITARTVWMGDFDNAFDGTLITVKDDLGDIDIDAARVNFTTDTVTITGTVLSGTASGSSGQHLKITINGTVYKIALLNN